MLGWLLGRLLTGEMATSQPEEPKKLFILQMIDDIDHADVIGILTGLFGEEPTLTAPSTYAIRNEAEIRVVYNNDPISVQSNHASVGIVNVGRMRTRGYIVTTNTVYIDVPISKHDINTRYQECIEQIGQAAHMVLCMLYVRSGVNPPSRLLRTQL